MELAARSDATKVSLNCCYANVRSRCINANIALFRDWKFEHPEHNSNISTPIAIRLKEKGGNPMNYSVRLVRVGEKSLFSKDVLYSLVLTNVLSMFIGAGIA